MLIKIQTAFDAGSFLIIDRVDSVRYDEDSKEFSSIEELTKYVQLMTDIESSRLVLDPRQAGMVYPNLPAPDAKPEEFIGLLSDKRRYRINTLTYERDGEMKSITFDTVAFICTDDGKTLERSRAGGAINYA